MEKHRLLFIIGQFSFLLGVLSFLINKLMSNENSIIAFSSGLFIGLSLVLNLNHLFLIRKAT